MIALLKGEIASTGEGQAVILVDAGVGYQFQATSRCLARLGGVGSVVTVLTDTQIRDDRIILTGFADAATRDAFRLLQTVQGVGSKAALSILSALSAEELLLAITAADKAMISRADGVGPKLAQRVINELADKVAATLPLSAANGSAAAVAGGLHEHQQTGSTTAMSNTETVAADAISALVNLGYGRSEAHAAVSRVISVGDSGDDTLLKIEKLLPLALKEIGR